MRFKSGSKAQLWIPALEVSSGGVEGRWIICFSTARARDGFRQHSDENRKDCSAIWVTNFTDNLENRFLPFMTRTDRRRPWGSPRDNMDKTPAVTRSTEQNLGKQWYYLARRRQGQFQNGHRTSRRRRVLVASQFVERDLSPTIHRWHSGYYSDNYGLLRTPPREPIVQPSKHFDHRA